MSSVTWQQADLSGSGLRTSGGSVPRKETPTEYQERLRAGEMTMIWMLTFFKRQPSVLSTGGASREEFLATGVQGP